jgi:plastocyanin
VYGLQDAIGRLSMVRHASRLVMAACGVVLGLFVGGAPVGVEAGGGCRGFASTEGTGTEVRMQGSCFVPTVLHVATGSTVTWTNDSTEPHNVAGATIEWGNYNELRNGETVQHRFERPGTYPYYCFVHNGMIGAVVVGDGRAAAVDDAESQPVAARVDDGPPETPAEAEATSMTSAEPDTSRWVFALLGALGGLAAGGFVAGIRAVRR